MSFILATTAHAATRPMVGRVAVCACVAKRNERIGQPDPTGTGGPHQA